jgi:50S ribosomal protein L16 3-hydroxylase
MRLELPGHDRSRRQNAPDLTPPLGRLTPRAFLKGYWQRKPLLVRGAFPAFRDPLSTRQLRALAASPAVESRLVLRSGGARPWQLRPGPLPASSLRRLPTRDWTILVQEAERHVPELAQLLSSFWFLPRWRVDDVMVSLAAPGGGVGPHVDSYDVFLVQGRGRRRWSIASVFDPTLRPGLELRVLRRFHPQRSWVLHPGDLLYLPPGVAHDGVALETSLTYSIGFRAPSRAELLVRALERAARDAAESGRYADPGLPLQRHPGQITAGSLSRFRSMLARGLRHAAASLPDLVGELVTEPRGVPPAPARRRVSAPSLATRLASGARLRPAPGTRLAFTRAAGHVRLFADGRAHRLPESLAPAAALIAAGHPLGTAELARYLRKPAFTRALVALVNAGALSIEPRPRHGAPSARP